MVKNPLANAANAKDTGDAWVGKIPWSRKWQLILVFLPETLHGQRSLAGYSPWSCKESDASEHTYTQ